MRQTNLLIYRLQSQKYHGLIFCFSVQVVNDIFLFWNYNPIVGAGCWWGLWLPTRRGCTSELTASGWWTTYSWCIRISKSRAATIFLQDDSQSYSPQPLNPSAVDRWQSKKIYRSARNSGGTPLYTYFSSPFLPPVGTYLETSGDNSNHQYSQPACRECCPSPSIIGPGWVSHSFNQNFYWARLGFVVRVHYLLYDQLYGPSHSAWNNRCV